MTAESGGVATAAARAGPTGGWLRGRLLQAQPPGARWLLPRRLQIRLLSRVLQAQALQARMLRARRPQSPVLLARLPRARRHLFGGAEAERGTGTVEFAVVLVTMVVPLVMAIVTMAAVQRAMLGTSGAAREAGRLFVTARTGTEAKARAVAAAREVLANHGLDEPGRSSVKVNSSCHGACRNGFGRGAEVEVTVVYRVPVLDPLGSVLGMDLPVRAVHRARVDPYRGL